ncbi:cbb3-type cytochrome c oxidase N-terminal domain-containing protein [Bremerella cremea]|uniref:cbb3-type cytochrome c oxidase N-terminal domain-containing protein n=1 Tax=Bremerella cremea TaxID=1031537 RepID=UPI0031E89913
MNSTEKPNSTADGHIPDDPLTGHSYDGIQEFDNPMPGWWKAMFLGSIIYAVFYWVYYENGLTPGRSVIAAYDRALAANLKERFSTLGEIKPDRETILRFSTDPEWLPVGKNVFQANCTSCHGNDAEGRVGPNLTDDHWKNIKNVEDLYRVIENGANGNAMPAWRGKLEPQEIILVSSYLLSLKGSNPAGKGLRPIPGETHVISDLDAPSEAASSE